MPSINNKYNLYQTYGLNPIKSKKSSKYLEKQEQKKKTLYIKNKREYKMIRQNIYNM